jgi:TonB family protein
MKLKLLGLLLCSLVYNHQSFGQRRENVYYFKNPGTKVDKVEDADFVRVVSEPDSGSTLFNVAEYYKNEKPKLVGKSSQVDPLVYEGMVISYYPSGKKQEIVNYQKGKRNGECYRYFPTGKVYLHTIYQQDDRPGMDMFIMDCIDTAGNAVVKDGIGQYVGYDGDFKRVMEQGEIKAGQKIGKWTGVTGFDQNAFTYTEDYQEGKLIAGNSVDVNNDTYTYTQRYVQPVFKGGLAAFGRYLGDGIRYPPFARTQRLEGKVVIAFVVKPDGSLDEFKVLQNPNEQMTAEAIRILKISPKWVPGVMYGKIVSVSYTVPVAFKL